MIWPARRYTPPPPTSRSLFLEPWRDVLRDFRTHTTKSGSGRFDTLERGIQPLELSCPKRSFLNSINLTGCSFCKCAPNSQDLSSLSPKFLGSVRSADLIWVHPEQSVATRARATRVVVKVQIDRQHHHCNLYTWDITHKRSNILQIIEGSLEVKLPIIWTDEKQSREEAERRERLEERRIEEKESEERRYRCAKR